MAEPFAEDPKLQQIAQAYAQDAVDFARQHANLPLDWSDASVAHIETILTNLYEQIASVKPSDEQVAQFGKLFGSYVGEVFRRNHGASWGLVTLEGQSFPGLKTAGSAQLFWPWGRVQNRLRNGPGDNVWHYYALLLSKERVAPPSAPPQTKRATWWQKLRGQ
jgi:hypothetical protein